MKPIKVGLLGLGTVGRGTYNVLKRNQEEITRRAGRGIEIAAVAVRDVGKAREVVGPQMPVTSNAEDVVRRPDIDIVVELIGGYEPARTLVLEAIARGKHVVTANKALLAKHGNEIFEAARAQGVMVAFEAAVAGGIPIIKALREGLTANRIEWIAGIINGTSNFILSEMRSKGLTFEAVLKEAQRLGYAEADPTFDVEGIDAAHKLAILSSIAFGVPINIDAAYTEGISKLAAADIRYAEQLGYRIKLLGITKRTPQGIELRVHPTLVPMQRLLASVEGAMNAVLVKGDAVGTTLYYGPGAGSEPTASAVIADLVDVTRMQTADPENHVPHLAFQAGLDRGSPVADDRRHGHLVLLPHARGRPARRAGGHHAHPRRRPDLDQRAVPARAVGGREPDRHHHAHARCGGARRERRDPAHRGAADRAGAGDPPAAGRAAVMQYVSTRGRAPTLGFSDVLLAGLATDGGLYLPAHYPTITGAELTRWRGLAYADLAAEVIAKFVDDIPQETLLELCRRTYTQSVYGNGRPDSDTALITPLRWLEPGLGLLELSNGPTLAFKDMAMQLLGALFEHVLERRGERLNVLGATSGRHGLGRRVRDAGPARHRGLHAVAARDA